jgi:hypothetical protein
MSDSGEVEDFWQVTFQNRAGETVCRWGNSDENAAYIAGLASQVHGRAMITTREGLVAVYEHGVLVGGVL